MVYFHFSEAGGLKSSHFYLFIHLFIYLSVFFSSNPNMVESGDSSRERSSSLFWLDGKQHSQSVVKEEGEERENKDRRESKTRGRKLSQSGRGRSQEGVTVSLRTEVLRPPAKSRLRLFLPTETWGKYESNERERERATARFGLAYPELIQMC